MNSTYSVAAGYFDEVRAIVEQGISIVFEERENLYMGGRYFNFRGSENERIRLLDNTTLECVSIPWVVLGQMAVADFDAADSDHGEEIAGLALPADAQAA
ncbi:MAG: hypothetical protein M0026_16635, partial [Nocardiopsaceae bacterium]|nr:hypothetical protein [Nocardiopsaceae bacterium]